MLCVVKGSATHIDLTSTVCVCVCVCVCRCMSAAKLGDILTLDAKCVKAGKTMAFATMDIVNKDTGALVAQGRQTKYLG